MSNQQGIDTDMKIIERIRSSPDPIKTMDMILDIMERLSAGEDAERIKGSYGADWDKYIDYRQ
jgi:hypothetical protein